MSLRSYFFLFVLGLPALLTACTNGEAEPQPASATTAEPNAQAIIDEAIAVVETCYRIHINQLIRTIFIIIPSKFFRFAQDAKALEVDAFDDAPIAYVQAGNDPL